MNRYFHKYIFAIVTCSLCFSACSYQEKIKDGKTAYARKQYAAAIPMLKKDYEKLKQNNDKAAQAYLLAMSYKKTHQYEEAAQYFTIADDLFYGKDAALQAAQMLQYAQNYDDAIKAYQKAGRQAGDLNYYREQIIACRNAKTWLQTEKETGYKVNKYVFDAQTSNELTPVIYQDSLLLFTADKTTVENKKEKYKWTDRSYFEVYQVPLTAVTENKNQKPAIFPFPKKSTYHSATPVFNKDFTEMYFCECGSDDKDVLIDYCKLKYAKKNGNEWSEPININLGDPQANYIHPYLKELDNGAKILFYASDTKQGYGGYDLYSAIWVQDEQRFSNPRNLGTINTKGNEVFPTFDADTLYFSSDGHPGMGGLDVFTTVRTPNTQNWSKPVNLKAPINSGADDFSFIFLKGDSVSVDSVLYRKGLFTSNRYSDKTYNDHIYLWQKETIIRDTTPVDTPAIAQAKIRLHGIVQAKVFNIAGNPNSGLQGYTPLPAASVQVSSEDTVFTIGVEENATFDIMLSKETDYTLRASKNGYFANAINVSTKGLVWDESKGDTIINDTIILEQIFLNQEIVLENIYYDYDDDKIRADAQPTLNQLAELLIRNPDIRIQLSSHTDCRGSDKYNLALSQRRAESAVRYLESKNIAPQRMLAKGYGESKPSNTCKCETCSEDEHQANRRTTFMVLE